MLHRRALAIADAHWAADFGCPADALFAVPFSLVTHSGGLAGYRGVFALFRAGWVMASVPPEHADTLRARLLALPLGCSPDDFAGVFGSFSCTVLGPASISYAEGVPPPAHPARALGPADAPALEDLRQSCDTTEWAHGGSDLGRPCSAVFVGRQIAALAGYEVWSDTVADLYIVTHPDHHGRGFGRSAVAHLAGRALANGLLPQYRTLVSNQASHRLADALGFCTYAMSVAVRLDRGGLTLSTTALAAPCSPTPCATTPRAGRAAAGRA